jgi:DNA-binding SARP family transcriptional activator
MLGELVIGRDGDRLPLPRGHRLIVLAVLLINANRRVSTPRLLQAGWSREHVVETQLHKCVSALRELLAGMGRREDLVTHPRYGYELRVPEGDLDKLVFERLVREADEAGSQRCTDDEIDLLRQALHLWRGQHPLAGVPAGAFRQEAADLEQRRKRTAVRLFELELGQRRYERILDELNTMVSYHPTDRRLCEQLMIALYHNGHTAEALEAYDRHHTLWLEETGAEPEPALRNLMYAIARADEATVARYEQAIAQPAATPGRPVLVPPRQLPSDPADFVGRDDLVAEARWLLSREPDRAAPVVVVSGPGGIGKTALAVHVAHLVRDRYPDGQLYVDLRGTSGQPVETTEVLAQLLRAFGVAKVPETQAERVALYRSLAAERQLLVVLDDAGDEAQIRDLIPGNPACGVLVTARTRLPDIGGAHHLPALEPLDAAASTELFLRVVSRSGVDRRAEPDATRRIVELCAGLPLALVVAGALRARDHGRTAAELAERLAHQRPEAFVYGERSVGRSIGAGFDQLDEHARRLFLSLGLLRLPDFGLWTAAAVLDGSGTDPAESLLRLASWNLLQPAGSGMRYRFHDLTREYARHRAESHYATEQQRHAVQQRVYAALLTLTRRAHYGIYGGDFEVVHGEVPDWAAPHGILADPVRAPLAWYEAERPNIRAAVDHTAALGLTELCWDLAVSAHEFYTIRGYFDDWYATHRIALTACQEAGNLRGEAVVLAILGQPALVASRRTGVSGPDDLRRSAELFERLGDRHGQAIALRTLANNLRRRGRYPEALATFTTALTHYAAAGDTVGRIQALRYIGQTHLDMEHHSQALTVLENAQDAARKALQPRLAAQIRIWVGHAHIELGDLAAARADFRSVLTAIGDSEGTGRAYATFGLGEAARRAGEHADAERELTVAAELAHGAADAVLEGRAHLALAHLYGARGMADRQLGALIQAVARFSTSDAAYLHANALTELGNAYTAQGVPAAARAAWAQARRLHADIDRQDAAGG